MVRVIRVESYRPHRSSYSNKHSYRSTKVRKTRSSHTTRISPTSDDRILIENTDSTKSIPILPNGTPSEYKRLQVEGSPMHSHTEFHHREYIDKECMSGVNDTISSSAVTTSCISYDIMKERPTRLTNHYQFVNDYRWMAYKYTKEKEKSQRRRRRRRGGFFAFCCPCCSPCCCLTIGLILGLLLVGLAILIALLIIMKQHSTTTTTTSTSTSSSSTSTSSTSSTSTSTTSDTTTTSETTSSTSTTSTSTATTSTTATTETTTSATTTISTSVTTTTAASTISIPQNSCTSSWQSVTVAYHCTTCSDVDPYVQYTSTYVAIASTTRISFALREDSGCFALDNVSVKQNSSPGTELLSNPGFETGAFPGWSYCNPYGITWGGQIKSNSAYFSNMGYTYTSKSGSYYYVNCGVGNVDYLYQTFPTTIGETYTISFWLYNHGDQSYPSSVDVWLSI
ncbi:unnamed protein product [Adineta ricciae]|uniref:Uncharacterized protein n=4 Tax=Adineta ricciae TaxID=249248 RepID=A0A815RVN9_ADIRI|nr:unnamed protein product [Adineta ricciae]